MGSAWNNLYLFLCFVIICYIKFLALAGVAQWTEYQPVNQRVACSIPSPAHMPRLWVWSLQGGGAQPHKKQPHIDISLSFSLPSPL